MPIDPQRWQRLSPWLDQVLDLPTLQRAAWLDDLAGRDAALAADLRALLASAGANPQAQVLQQPSPSLALQALAGRRIGAYTLLQPLGEGGMGAVWLAERSDGRFEGRAAVKLLHAGLVQRALAERFRREGAILAKLAHPHIARLVDAGLTADGQPYLVLEHVDGERIDRWCDGRRLDVRARLVLFGQVLQAVQHAHAQLVVHRDLKPANVMVDARGQVKLLDFGIAKLLHDEGTAEATELTRDAGRVLTPLYAAPEQASGAVVSTATDLFALGLLLYVLLTGQHPRVGADGQASGDDTLPLASRVVTDRSRRSDDERAAAAAARDTTAVRLAAALAGDLDNILAKALRVEPGERYATVSALADDIQRHLDGHTVSARPDSWAYRTSRFVARHRLGVGLVGTALAAIVGMAVLADQQRRAAEHERDLATQQRAAADAVASFLEEALGQLDEPGQPSDPATRIEQAERRAQQLFFDQPGVLVRLHGLFHNVNAPLGRDEAARRNIQAIEAAGRQAGADPLLQAEVWCAPEPAMSDADAVARIDRGLALLPPGADSGALRARCLIHRASHLRNLGRHEDSLRDVEEANAVAPTLQRRLMAMAYLRSKASHFNETGQPHAADQALAEVGHLMLEAGRGRSVRMWEDLNWRAIFHWHMGRPREAIEFVERAAQLARPGSGAVASSRGMAALRANMLMDAERTDEALQAYERLFLRDGKVVQTEAPMDPQYTIAERLRGDSGKAVELLERDWAEHRGKVPPWRETVNRMILAETLVMRGDGPRALAALDELLSTPKAELARFQQLDLRSRAQLLAGQPVQAEATARLAVAEAVRRSSAERRSAVHGRAYLALARALAAQGRDAEAHAAAERAAAEFTDALGAEHSSTRAALVLARR